MRGVGGGFYEDKVISLIVFGVVLCFLGSKMEGFMFVLKLYFWIVILVLVCLLVLVIILLKIEVFDRMFCIVLVWFLVVLINFLILMK